MKSKSPATPLSHPHERTILEIGDELAKEAERYIDIGWDLAHESKRLTELIKEYRAARARVKNE